MKKSLQLACLLTFAASIGAYASVYTWRTDVAEGAWTDSVNWLVDGEAATAVPGASDTVQFVAGEKAVIVLDANTSVGTITGPGADTDIVFRGASETVPFLRCKGFGSGAEEGGSFTFDAVKLLPNYASDGWSQWNLNENEVKVAGKCTLATDNGGALYFGKLTAPLGVNLAVRNGATLWIRAFGSNPEFNLELENASFTGFQKALSCTDANIVFKGDSPEWKTPANPNVAGTLTFDYVLPAKPYANGPFQNSKAFDFTPAGKVIVKVDAASPAFSSGAKQTYRLFKFDNSTAYGILTGSIACEPLRTVDEVYAYSNMDGASGLPQYLDVTVDGTYDPDAAPIDVRSDKPYPVQSDTVRFAGTVANLGSGAERLTIYLEYGLDGGLDHKVAIAELDAVGAFSYDLGGLDGEATYTYRLSAVNSSVADWIGETLTFSLICGSELNAEFGTELDNGNGKIVGTLDVLGSGATVISLWVGRSVDALEEVASIVPKANGAFAIPYRFAADGAWYYQVKCANQYAGQSWSDSTDVKSVTISDSNVYTWIGGNGSWSDVAKWSSASAASGLGYPTTASSVVFPAGVTAVVTLDGNVTIAALTLSMEGSDITFSGSASAETAPVLLASKQTFSGSGVLTLRKMVLRNSLSDWSMGNTVAIGAGGALNVLDGAALYCQTLWVGQDARMTVAGESKVWCRTSATFPVGSTLVLENSVFEGPDQGAPFHFQQSSVEFRGSHPRLVGFIGACEEAQFIFALPLTPYETAPISISKAIGNHYLSLDAGEKAIALVIPRDCPARKEGKFGVYPIIDWAKKTGYGIVTTSFDLNPAAGKLFVGDRFDFGFAEGYDTGDDALPTDLTFTLSCHTGTTLLVR